MKIAIDGPAGAGKSTVAKLLAKSLGMIYIDTGAMYRAIALGIISLGIDTNDAGAVVAGLEQLSVGIEHDVGSGEQLVRLNGEDITSQIRAPRISAGASDVSRVPEVRLRLVELQRDIAAGRDVVMDGRDIGTYVFPDADKKYYLTASANERARRRFLELRAKGGRVSYEECLNDMIRRDENDKNRAFAPLAIASDATIIYSDGMTALEVADLMHSEDSGFNMDNRGNRGKAPR